MASLSVQNDTASSKIHLAVTSNELGQIRTINDTLIKMVILFALSGQCTILLG